IRRAYSKYKPSNKLVCSIRDFNSQLGNNDFYPTLRNRNGIDRFLGLVYIIVHMPL
ncbi:hypothetical protein HHI36_004576, partial [Cryptolaemus montrouzieri]